MFKAFGDFIHRTPWWAMILLGISVLILLVAFSAPVHVIRLSESGATPEERQAIKREIDRAFGDNALNIAENIVETIKDRSNDPARKVEMERALSEIAQARKEIFKAQRDATVAARDAMREAQENALDSAVGAAESALDAAKETREAVEEAKSEAAEKLKSTGADTAAALAAFDEMIKVAKAKESVARESLKKLQETRKRGINITLGTDDALKINVQPGDKASVGLGADGKGVKKDIFIPLPDAPTAPSGPKSTKSPVAPPAPLAKPANPSPPAAPSAPVATHTEEGVNFDGTVAGKRVKGNINIDDNGKIAINLPHMAPMPPLPPELREDIKSGVASDVRRIGIGSAMVLAFIPIFIMMLIAKFFIDRSRRAQAFAEQKKQEADVSNVNRQITEARLQALQAQVEPHFLYNTLANVQALTEVDPAQANQMTGHLIQYLRSSLPKMRENTSTVGQEIELVRAYLNILKMRMGARLDFGIDCPADLMTKPFPPMMLPSLVENAIKHGLEPQREGGRIDVIVMPVMTAEGERIRVIVKDTGRGLTDAPVQAGGGVGLSNIRERLIALYGDAGKLALESNEPKGVIASIEIPAEPMVLAGTSTFNGKAPGAVKPPAPKGWWGKTRYAIATTHGVWAKIMSTTFVAMMIGLAVIFGLAIAGLYTGLLPMNIGNSRIDGLEGMALGTLMLVAVFGVVALVLLVVVGVLYGLGLLFAGLLFIIPLIVVIAAFPALAPFIVIGFLVYWFWFRKRRKSKPADGA